jgi:hypothetical protein
MKQIAVFSPAIPLSATPLTPLVSCALVATPLALLSRKLWAGPEPDLFERAVDDGCDLDAEAIRKKNHTVG